MNATVVREKREAVLPLEVVEAAGLQPGDRVDWWIEDGEIRGRKSKSSDPIVLGLGDVPADSILPRGWQVEPADIAAAVREERDEA